MEKAGVDAKQAISEAAGGAPATAGNPLAGVKAEGGVVAGQVEWAS